jgi:hypothetical protein
MIGLRSFFSVADHAFLVVWNLAARGSLPMIAFTRSSPALERAAITTPKEAQAWPAGNLEPRHHDKKGTSREHCLNITIWLTNQSQAGLHSSAQPTTNGILWEEVTFPMAKDTGTSLVHRSQVVFG